MKAKAGNGKPYLSAFGAFALAFGCSVGWGSFVMPGTTFLPIAGPVGTAIGIGLGALVMLVIGANYHYLMQEFPDAGGTYTYTKRYFSYDHGFLNAWFLILTYITILWANATALPLIARTLFGDLFQFGFHYEVAGFDVYLGEILLSVIAILLGALLTIRRKLAEHTQIVMAVLLFAGVVFCFAAAMGRPDAASFTPAFSPTEGSFAGTVTIFALAPWAYVGFESITHSAGEARFPLKRSFAIMAAALLAAGLVYALLALLAVTALPEGRADWVAYIFHLGEHTGLASTPTFFSANAALGDLGSILLGVAALAGIFTGIIGNYIALSRLIGAVAKDGLLPKGLAKLDENNVPRRAILCILGVSVLVPLLGRTAISWIVDVTTVGATIAYAFASAAAFKAARKRGNKRFKVMAVLGVAISLLFALEFLIPNILSVKTLATESYLILAAWGLLGFVVFRFLLKRDKEKRLGRSTVVWIVLLGLIIFTSSVWMSQSADIAIEKAAVSIQDHFMEHIQGEAQDIHTVDKAGVDVFVKTQLSGIERSLDVSIFVQIALIVAALLLLFDMYALTQKRERETEIEKAVAEEASRAKTIFLSNMSHEIRTPMNAIIGLDNMALRNPELSPKTRDQLEKIGLSARHLLRLINDILDMSRIESGRMTLRDEEFLLRDLMDSVNVMILSQCQDKGLTYENRVVGAVADYYFGDDMKLRQVLINILGNSVKFTEPPGKVEFLVEQVRIVDGKGVLRFSMRDSGIGMDEEYIPKIFEAFSQENSTTTNHYGGSGLGMAITKNYVEMMGGRIEVKSKKGVGSVFTVTLPLRISDRRYVEEEPAHLEEASAPDNLLAGRRVLMAEDVEQNAEILGDLLELEEMLFECAKNGQEAVDMFRDSPVGHYDAILMDVRMPIMDGLSATRAIRQMSRADASAVPIIAMTANVFEEDMEQSLAAGMNAHLSKPIEPELLFETLAKLLAKK